MDQRLTPCQYLELLLGARDDASAFDSEDSRRAAWQAHRAELLRMVEPGSRPSAWWEYEAPEPLCPGESDVAYLTRCRLLTAAERRTLRAPNSSTSSTSAGR